MTVQSSLPRAYVCASVRDVVARAAGLPGARGLARGLQNLDGSGSIPLMALTPNSERNMDRLPNVKNLATGQPVNTVECNTCGDRVGMVQSKRTGRWYTCQLVPSENPDSDAMRACPWVPHREHCQRTIARRAELVQEMEREEHNRALLPELERLIDATANDPSNEALRQELREHTAKFK